LTLFWTPKASGGPEGTEANGSNGASFICKGWKPSGKRVSLLVSNSWAYCVLAQIDRRFGMKSLLGFSPETEETISANAPGFCGYTQAGTRSNIYGRLADLTWAFFVKCCTWRRRMQRSDIVVLICISSKRQRL